MSSGIQHRNASIALAGSVFVASLLTQQQPSVSIPLTLGCLFGIILSPDLDIDRKTISETIVLKIPIVGWVFYWFWLPYAYAIPHRASLSHFPVFSTLFRVVYAAIGINVLVLLLRTLGVLSPEQCYMYLQTYTMLPFWLFVYGLCLSDICHWVADGFPL